MNDFVHNDGHRRRGFSLLDVMLALGISATMYASVAQMQNDLTSRMRAEAAGSEMLMLSQASRMYMDENNDKLQSLGSVFEVPVSGNTAWNGIGDLTSTGMLPENYQNEFPGGQKAHLLVRKVVQNGNIPTHLEGMLITAGGSPMNDRQVGMAMARMGGNGGGIMQNPPPGVSTTNIQGSFASWSQPISQWSAAGVVPTYGHLAYDINTTGASIGEWLSRFNTGNPEANRLHTNVDMDNNNMNGVNTINGLNNNDIHMNDGEHTGRIVMQNGGMACQGDATGCNFDVSDDGGFYDYNNGWINYQGSWANKGLRIAGQGNNLQVYGQTVANGGVLASDVAGVSWSGSPSVHGSVEAAATYGNGWLNINGAGGFQGISTQIVQGTQFQDVKDNSYYLIPSQVSHLNNANFQGRIGVDGYDYMDGIPSGWGGGVQTYDVYAHGSIGVGDNQQKDAKLDNNGGFIDMSQYVTAQTIRPEYIAKIGDSCSNLSVNGMMGRKISFSVQNGDIARDADGYAVFCSNGIWDGDDEQYQVQDLGTTTSGVNTTGYPMYLSSMDTGGGFLSLFHKHFGSIYVDVNGQQVCSQVASNYDRGHCFVIVPAGASWDTGSMNRPWIDHHVVVWTRLPVGASPDNSSQPDPSVPAVDPDDSGAGNGGDVPDYTFQGTGMYWSARSVFHPGEGEDYTSTYDASLYLKDDDDGSVISKTRACIFTSSGGTSANDSNEPATDAECNAYYDAVTRLNKLGMVNFMKQSYLNGGMGIGVLGAAGDSNYGGTFGICDNPDGNYGLGVTLEMCQKSEYSYINTGTPRTDTPDQYDSDDDSDSDTTTLSNSDIIMEDYYIFIYGVDAWNQIATAAGLPTVQTLPKCIQGNAVSEFVDHLAGKCYGGYAYYDGSWHFDSVGWIVYNGYWAFGANHMDLADAF